MRRLFPLLLLALLLPSCHLLRQAKGINQRYYAGGELKRITTALRVQEPIFQVPLTLYLTDDHGKYKDELERLLAITPISDPLSAKVALLMGDGEALLVRTSDTILTANAHLLMGNIFEAERLMGLSSKRDPATESMIELRQGRENKAIALLERLISKGDDTDLQLRAARLLSFLGKGGWDYLSQYSPSEWERFMAVTQLGNRTATTPREIAYTKYTSALAQPDSLVTKEAAQLLLSEPSSPWRQYALQHLLPQVIEQKHWVELYRMVRELPEMAVAQPIYYQILQFEKEVELMARFEAPEELSMSTVPTTPREGSFRSVWGNVSNVDNWVMERSNLLSSPTLITPPTREQYDSTHRLITEWFAKNK